MNPAHLGFTMAGFSIDSGPRGPSGSCSGWLMTAVSSWGATAEDAFDQCLVELGLGDSRLIRVEGAMLPMGFAPAQPEPLPMGSLVECHLAVATAEDGGTASAGAAWALAVTPEGDECGVVATMSTDTPYEETESLLRLTLKRKLASRDLEVTSHELAVDEVTVAADHHGCAIAALILPDSLRFQSTGATGRVRGLIRSAGEAQGGDLRPTQRKSDDVSFDL